MYEPPNNYTIFKARCQYFKR